jgi:hypothetical protein
MFFILTIFEVVYYLKLFASSFQSFGRCYASKSKSIFDQLHEFCTLGLNSKPNIQILKAF